MAAIGERPSPTEDRSRACDGNRARRATRVLGALTAALAALAGGSALAFTPADILASPPTSERSLRQAAAVSADERALADASAGTRATLAATPGVAYGADVEVPAALTPSLAVDLKLAWRYDRVAVLSDRIALLADRERLHHWQRGDVLDGLRLLGRTLRAEVALARAELDLERTLRSGSEAPASQRARVRVTARRHALESLRADARDLGLVGEARLEPWTFALPAAGTTLPQRRRLVLELEAARLKRDHAAVFDVLRNVSLDATYESRSAGYQLSASLSLDRGRPAAAIGGQLGPQEDDQWRLSLSASFRLGGDASARTAGGERVRRAAAALAAFDAGRPRAVAEARAVLADARAALAAELDAWGAEARTPRSPSACRSLLARENAVYAAWLDVVDARYRYLELVDAGWSRGQPLRSSPQPSRHASTSPVRAPAVDGDALPMPPAAWPARPSDCAAPPT